MRLWFHLLFGLSLNFMQVLSWRKYVVSTFSDVCDSVSFSHKIYHLIVFFLQNISSQGGGNEKLRPQTKYSKNVLLYVILCHCACIALINKLNDVYKTRYHFHRQIGLKVVFLVQIRMFREKVQHTENYSVSENNEISLQTYTFCKRIPILMIVDKVKVETWSYRPMVRSSLFKFLKIYLKKNTRQQILKFESVKYHII